MIHRLPFVALLLSSTLMAPSAFAQDAAPAPAPSAGPANLCQELVAFVKKPEEKKQEAATPASQATAVSNPSGKSEGQPSASGGQPQQSAGLSAPPTTQAKAPGSEAPAPAATASDAKTVRDDKSTGGDKTLKDGMAVLAQANAAAKNPPPPAAPAPSPKPDEALIAKIDAAAAANDQATCRAAARTMRVAGVIMPPPLLALSALDPKFFAGSQP
ncbi:hypothetical protein [Methylobacterium goesingense]|uniref:Uncharacterized protein n=1 Tax=Methylobacterium goesingense TaxID=243690 RepID=A0ABV2L3X2_9HYPH|nr:hypothetical protein [Methylobacterium goesingense]GJD74867.1 hypothetical protein CFIICLFH_3107 [Methylobacterium goesingense]